MHLRISPSDKDAAFIKIDDWKRMLDEYIAKAGSAIKDKQWQLKFFEFCKAKQDQKFSSSDVPFNVSQNEQLLTTDKKFSQKQKLKLKEQEKETG
jgi:hypothetical protein